MSEKIKQDGDFIGYEYKDVLVSRSLEPLYADGLVNFGWVLEDISPAKQNYDAIMMHFKRNRKLRNKTELTRLQQQFESTASEIKALEKSKVFLASAAAYGVGLVGTAFMSGAVFSYLAGKIILCIILAIPAFVGWVIPYFSFLSLRNKKTNEVTPLIDKKHDELYEICEKANVLVMS